MKHIFNLELLLNLGEIMHMDGKDLAKAAGFTPATWSRVINKQNDITVQSMMKLCNSLQIPIRHFVVSYEGDKQPQQTLLSRKDYVIDNEYKPCYWNERELRARIGPNSRQVQINAIAEVIGCSPVNFGNRLTLDVKFKMTDFLLMCSHFNIPWDSILVDDNRRCPPGDDGGQNVRPGYDMEMLRAVIHDVIAPLQQEIKQLRREVTALRAKASVAANLHSTCAPSGGGTAVKRKRERS